MASARANTIAQGFSQRLLKEMYDRSILDDIVNRDYQGEINGVGSTLNIYNLARISEKTYTPHTPLVMDSLYENNAQLVIDQYKSFYWGEYDIDNWLAYIKDPHSTVVSQKADERLKNMDLFAFGKYAKVAAGNRVGTNVTAGTVTVDANGSVTGSGTAFTEAMEGRGIKIDGQTEWYRVKTYVAADGAGCIIIEDDKDDVDSDYTGPVISSSATYVVEAVTAATITGSNLLTQLGQVKLKLDVAERLGKSAVPADGRFIVVPPEFEDLATNGGVTGVSLHIPEVYENLTVKGMIGMLKGMKIYVSNHLTGNNTDGFRIIAGHNNWMTFAEKQLNAQIEEDVPGDFATAFKDLFVYGCKVPDTRRHFAVEAFWKF